MLFNVKVKIFCSTFLAVFHIYVIYLQIFMVLGKKKKKKKKKLAQ